MVVVYQCLAVQAVSVLVHLNYSQAVDLVFDLV